MQKKNVVGSKIRDARLARTPTMTQDDLSGQLAKHGVTLSASSIGKIENGTRPVTDIQLLAFAKALKVEPAWLLK